jgi:hypothetical protein
MKDGRLTRTYISLNARNYEPKHSHGIALIPLGDRNRVIDFGDEAVEERKSDKTRMYLR